MNKGSLKNKLAILSVEAPGWQGAKTGAYILCITVDGTKKTDRKTSRMVYYFVQNRVTFFPTKKKGKML